MTQGGEGQYGVPYSEAVRARMTPTEREAEDERLRRETTPTTTELLARVARNHEDPNHHHGTCQVCGTYGHLDGACVGPAWRAAAVQRAREWNPIQLQLSARRALLIEWPETQPWGLRQSAQGLLECLDSGVLRGLGGSVDARSVTGALNVVLRGLMHAEGQEVEGWRL